jgi:glutaredoxin-like protein NrdH
MSETAKNEAATVTVYSKPACPQCVATETALTAKGIAFSKIDMSQDQDALELVKSMGHRSAPVVVVGDESWSGFRPDMIAKIAAQPAAA